MIFNMKQYVSFHYDEELIRRKQWENFPDLGPADDT